MVRRRNRILVCSLALCLSVGAPLSCYGADAAEEKDFSEITSAKELESSYSYSTFFLPAIDGFVQPYVGDPMPYYEDGVYYIYYLKEQGDSYHHSIYLATTTDFVSYTELDDPVLEASWEGGQDDWIGTGSVVKVGETYYFFYTGHTDTEEYKEKIMVASGDSPTNFEKMTGWDITPPDELGQKNDFRDPQAYYDPESGTITMTVTESSLPTRSAASGIWSAAISSASAIPGTSAIPRRTTRSGTLLLMHPTDLMANRNAWTESCSTPRNT